MQVIYRIAANKLLFLCFDEICSIMINADRNNIELIRTMCVAFLLCKKMRAKNTYIVWYYSCLQIGGSQFLVCGSSDLQAFLNIRKE